MTRAAIAVAGVAIAIVLFVVLRPSDGTDGTVDAATTNPLTVVETVETVPTATTTTTQAQPPQRVVVNIDATRDRIARPKVQRGRQVVIRVTADVADHVHVHGYDLMADVAPGRPAEISFRATIPGVFEIELEDAGRLIAELEVTS